jgi:hypothetical protein
VNLNAAINVPGARMDPQTPSRRSFLIAGGRSGLFSLFAVATGTPGMIAQAAGSAATQGQVQILSRDEAAAVMPATVFFEGQTAAIQARNSSGLRIAGKQFVLAALVDTSGYSTGVQQRYQAYLITEVRLTVGGKVLTPGAYGFGFLAGDAALVMDLGGNELVRAAATHDEALRRPTPLQILADPQSPRRFRLYLGRTFVALGL